ncbi:MAG TPA: RNA polymerase-associated protein rapA [Chromatiales bacterium]|nr:RNA polymerase-associated protein rapA [Thiotrichales bacterium]HIP69385.1 RNA polymerase-associated protein rapA [Chromatiales bacterium]
MQLKRSLLAVAITALWASTAQAEVEYTGYFKNETAIFLKDGQTVGQAKSMLDTEENDAGDIFKSEWMLKSFLNGDLGENSTWHAEINLIGDSEAVNSRLRKHLLYTQHDYFRELYLDTSAGDWNFRLGKQQVVWGTADGIKLLDIINPTDFRELNQNTQEDSRVPVWMANIERNIGESSNVQLIISEARANFIPGLDGDSDQGQPFILTGVDTITGKVNGFLNIAPNLGNTAASFVGLAQQGFGAPSLTLAGGGIFTVQDFVNGGTPFCATGSPTTPIPGPQSPTNPFAGLTCSGMLNAIAQGGFPGIPGNAGVTNLVDPVYDSASPSSAFEYMGGATFATFDTFAGITTRYEQNHPDAEEGNFGLRFKSTTGGGTNYSINYLYNYNPNPSVNIHWEDATGNNLTPTQVSLPSPPPFPAGSGIILLNADGSQFTPAAQGGPATLVFEETLDRIHNIGGSFDTSIDMGSKPVVIRGEFLYQKDVMVPVVDRSELNRGNISEALKTEEADFFRSVIGVDVTVLTNLLVSTQLINFFNLDYVDENTDLNGNACTITNCGRYTGDPTNLSLRNGLKKGDEIETFVSFFLSKPFGPSQQHRWNNIIIAENDGGYWDRFDIEYSFTDFFLGMAEANFYWGDEDTLFGQLENSSNFQLGVKVLFQ